METLSNLEDEFYKKGHQAGYLEGQSEGRIEGFQLGITSSFQIWEELSFYKSQLNLILTFKQSPSQLQQQSTTTTNCKSTILSSKLTTKLTLLLGLIDSFPKINSTEEEVDLISKLNTIRSNYKLCCNLLSIKARLHPNSIGF